MIRGILLRLMVKGRGEARVSCLGGLSPGHGERGSASLQRGSGAEPPAGCRGRAPGQGVRGRIPPEAENLLAARCATEAENLPHSPQFANSVNPRHS